jgi:hypothetical protein
VTALTVEAPAGTTGSGEFTGYLCAWQRDHGGDTIEPTSVAGTLADFKSGQTSWLLTAGHAGSNDTSGLVAYVTDAELDHVGLKITGKWLPGETAQRLREAANAGAPIGLSIDYLVTKARPDGHGGRILQDITIVGGALVNVPMNSRARITESKGGGTFPSSVPVVDVYADAQARRADPQRQREDAILQAADWPPRDWPRDMRLALIMDTAAAKAARPLPEDDGRRVQRERWERNNKYSADLHEWLRTATACAHGGCLPGACKYQ